MMEVSVDIVEATLKENVFRTGVGSQACVGIHANHYEMSGFLKLLNLKDEVSDKNVLVVRP